MGMGRQNTQPATQSSGALDWMDTFKG